MFLVPTIAGREILRRLASAMIARLVWGADRKTGLDEKASRVAVVMDGVWGRVEWWHLYVTAGEIGGNPAAEHRAPRVVQAAYSER